MKNQRGAALVVVLALLTGALVLGVSGMQGALIDERLAGNYRSTTLAQMAAEAGIAMQYPAPSSDITVVNDSCEGVRKKGLFVVGCGIRPLSWARI